MSATLPVNTGLPATSFKERLAQRRKELEAKTSVVLAVPGYEHLGLYARYRVLGYEDIREIGLRQETEAMTQTEGERNTAAQTLADACEDLMEKTGEDEEGRPIFQTLGYRWSAKAASDLFEVDNLPEGALAVTAVKAIFPYPHDMLMMRHFQEYLADADLGIGEMEGQILGESQVPSAGTSSPS